jgi:hypothetical protein
MGIELETATQLGITELPPLRDKLEEAGIVFSDDYARGSGFLFPDGKFLCMVNQTDPFFERSVVAHHIMDDYIADKGMLGWDDYRNVQEFNHIKPQPKFQIALQTRVLEHTDGAITLNDGTNYNWENCYIDLPPLKPVSQQQYDALLRWLDDKILSGTRTRLDVGMGVRQTSIEFKEGMISEDIIKEIKRFAIGKD